MKYRTYKNMVRATQMIADKGYDWAEANEMAIGVFNYIEMYGVKNCNSAEFYISKIAPKAE